MVAVLCAAAPLWPGGCDDEVGVTTVRLLPDCSVTRVVAFVEADVACMAMPGPPILRLGLAATGLVKRAGMAEWASAKWGVVEICVVEGEFSNAASAGVGVVVVFVESNRPGSTSAACVECDSTAHNSTVASGDAAHRGADVAGNALPVHPGRRGRIEELLWMTVN